MKAAILGAGGAGLLHALSYRAHGVPVIAVFDPDAERAHNLASLCNATAYPSLDSVAQSEASCISICSPPKWHVDQAEACARSGRTLFIEKPVAISFAELARLRRLNPCVPILQWRSGRAIRAIKTAIANGLFGPSPSVSLDATWYRDAAYFDKGRASREHWGCGALLSIGIHILDAACFALDRPVTKIHCERGYRNPSDGLENRAAVIAAFEGGSILTARVTLDSGPDETRIAFAGNGLTATISGTEIDPTASEVRWTCTDESRRRIAETIETNTNGYVAAPLLVPFLGRAMELLKQGVVPGERADLPSIRDVGQAHEIALGAIASSQEDLCLDSILGACTRTKSAVCT